MKTNKSNKIYKVISIVTIAVSGAIMCIMLTQVLSGSLTMYRASELAYFSEDVSAVTHVHDINMIHEIGL